MTTGLLLQQGERHVFGRSNKGGPHAGVAANITRAVLGVAFALTVAGHTEVRHALHQDCLARSSRRLRVAMKHSALTSRVRACLFVCLPVCVV